MINSLGIHNAQADNEVRHANHITSEVLWQPAVPKETTNLKVILEPSKPHFQISLICKRINSLKLK